MGYSSHRVIINILRARQIADILQKTFSDNSFSWIKIGALRYEIDRNLYLRVQLIISQQRLR